MGFETQYSNLRYSNTPFRLRASEIFLSSLHSEFFSNLLELRIDRFACFTDFCTLQRFSAKNEAQPDTLLRIEPWLTPLRQAQTNDWNANVKDRKNCLAGA